LTLAVPHRDPLRSRPFTMQNPGRMLPPFRSSLTEVLGGMCDRWRGARGLYCFSRV